MEYYGHMSTAGDTHMPAKINTVWPWVVSLESMKICQLLKLNFKCYNHAFWPVLPVASVRTTFEAAILEQGGLRSRPYLHCVLGRLRESGGLWEGAVDLRE